MAARSDKRREKGPKVASNAKDTEGKVGSLILRRQRRSGDVVSPSMNAPSAQSSAAVPLSLSMSSFRSPSSAWLQPLARSTASFLRRRKASGRSARSLSILQKMGKSEWTTVFRRHFLLKRSASCCTAVHTLAWRNQMRRAAPPSPSLGASGRGASRTRHRTRGVSPLPW